MVEITTRLRLHESLIAYWKDIQSIHVVVIYATLNRQSTIQGSLIDAKPQSFHEKYHFSVLFPTESY